jgi:hypothetical protein
MHVWLYSYSEYDFQLLSFLQLFLLMEETVTPGEVQGLDFYYVTLVHRSILGLFSGAFSLAISSQSPLMICNM